MVLILITNDDGVNADGLHELIKAVSSLGDIVVIAPNTQQSGKGKSVTYTKPVRLQSEPYFTQEENIKAYSIDGTPADSVIIGQKVCKNLYAKKPDLIFLDINMPEMSGDEVAQILSSRPETKEIPVVFLTALVTKEEVGNESMASLGKYNYIAKPITTKELVTIIKKILK